MPIAPLRTCSGSPVCRTLVKKGVCSDCARRRERLRGSRHDRGYDAAWVALVEAFWKTPAHRSCRLCASRGIQERATQVDHIVPFQGKDDPRRLDPTNLQPLCGTCNRRKALAHRYRTTYDVIWDGTLDAQGRCPTLIDGTFSRPSALGGNAVIVNDED